MGLNLENLELESVRDLMLDEFQNDIDESKIYLSDRLKDEAKEVYLDLMKQAIQKGSDDSLAQSIISNNCLKAMMSRKKPKGGFITYKMPIDAHLTMAEGEFNRFYLRALCRKAVEIKKEIEVYRAKTVKVPRPESIAMIGKTFEPKKLLVDLRTHIGVDTALGLPPGPNSGLSGRIKKEK